MCLAVTSLPQDIQNTVLEHFKVKEVVVVHLSDEGWIQSPVVGVVGGAACVTKVHAVEPRGCCFMYSNPLPNKLKYIFDKYSISTYRQTVMSLIFCRVIQSPSLF